MKKEPVQFRDLGRMEYKAAWEYQEKLLQENVQIKQAGDPAVSTTHYLLFTEHPAVYTLGKSGKAKFKVESAPYDPAWTVRLRPDIDRMETL